ncbi:hypothetical protein K503DRAFT_807066 [Rhizopogon vinicolor AM-OR11-026]|uniref:Uncharacterized protein n=1 Tax=Rhizopogon vinicolor AM-OR11-026 TaxID=1314800 RepID=A0A1B7MD92_9AGAM|nr:hypothetical protein K503DRAFT_807066 [Rhizopogon vinicolor AM-OR11-026]
MSDVLISSNTPSGVCNGTHVDALIVLPLFMVDPDKMIRTDRTLVGQVRHTSSKTEFFIITSTSLVRIVFTSD